MNWDSIVHSATANSRAAQPGPPPPSPSRKAASAVAIVLVALLFGLFIGGVVFLFGANLPNW